MGTRLTIEDASGSIIFYGTKLYGYADISDLKSYMYLFGLEKLEDDWDAYNPENWKTIRLTADQFMKFIGYYSQDYFDKYGVSLNEVNNTSKLEESLFNDEDKYISWG